MGAQRHTTNTIENRQQGWAETLPLRILSTSFRFLWLKLYFDQVERDLESSRKDLQQNSSFLSFIMKKRQLCGSVSLLLWFFSSYTIATTTSSECQHGISLPDGTCDCFSCWSGDTCDRYASYPPTFPVSYDHVALAERHLDGEILYYAKATDLDEALCKDPEGCPCSTVTYTLEPEALLSIFYMDEHTGELSVTNNVDELMPSFELVLKAMNGDGFESSMTLSVTVNELGKDKYLMTDSSSDLDPELSGLRDGEGVDPLHRHRRATPPGEVTFVLTKTGSNSGETSMKVGTKYNFQLLITMPVGPTTLKVELFAPDFDFTVMMLCDVAITQGSVITYSIGTPTIDLQSSNDNNQYDRAVIDLGTVSNVNTGNLVDSQITITYSAVMIFNSLTQNSQYWVSAGAEYDNAENVWVGQAGFNADTSDDSATFTASPDVTVNGPATLEIGDAGLYTLNAKVPAPYSTLKFNMFGGVNTTNALGACGARLDSWGVGYSCGNAAVDTFTPVTSAEGDSVGYGRIQLDLGTPLNSLARLHAADSNEPMGEFSMTFLARMYDNEDNIGSVYHLGFALEIGATTLWVAQTAVTAAAHTTISVAPSLAVTFPNVATCSESRPVMVDLELTLPDDSVGDYIIEVTTPTGSSGAFLQTCAFIVKSSGANIPCVDPTKEAVYSSTLAPGLDIYNNKARLEIGKLSSAGSSWSSEADANKIVFSVAVKATEHTSAGQQHDVTFSVIKDGSALSPLTGTVTVDNAATATPITNDNVPSVNMSYGGDGSDTVMPGKTVKVIADIQTTPDTVYIPFNFEAVMPNISGVPAAKICKVELHAAGRNTPCMLDATIQQKVTLMSSFQDGVLDRAVLPLDGLCNLGISNVTGADNFALAVSLALLDNSLSNPNPQWISMGLAYSSTNLWVGQIAVNADSASSISALAEAPNLVVLTNNGNLTSVPVGYTAKFLVRIKLRPDDFTLMRVDALTTDNTVSICGIRLVRAGGSYPCIDTAPVSTISDLDPAVGVNRKGSIDLGYLGNVGTDMFVVDNYYDENTIEVEVAAKLVSGSEGSTHNIDVQINYDANYATTLTSQGSVTATTTTPAWLTVATTPADLNVGTSLTSVSITGNDTAVTDENIDTVVLGESKRLVFEYETERYGTSALQVDVSSPDSDTKTLEVMYIGLLSRGQNLQCLNDAILTSVYSKRVVSRTFNDLGSLDLGFVCNSGAENTTEADTLRLEIVVKLLPGATVSVGENLVVSTALTSNGQSSLLISKTFTVADASVYKDFEKDGISIDNSTGIVFNSTEVSITMAVAATKVIPLVFMIPPHSSSRVYLDVQMPVNTSAIITFTSFQITRSGRSLGPLADWFSSFTETLTYAFNTTQVTKYDLDLGVITNPGMTKNLVDYTTDDDTFSAELTLQMADSVVAEQSSTHIVSVGTHVAKFVFIMDVSIGVDRSTHNLVFNMSSAVDSLASDPSHVEVDTILSLSDLSTAEGQDTVINIFYPPYVTCQASITSDKKEIKSQQHINNSLSLGLGTLFFTDEVHIKTILDANTGYEVPTGISGLDSVLLFQPMGDEHDQVDVVGEFDYVNITVTTTTSLGTECSPVDLGMETSVIKDCQISASPDSITAATNGRYTVGSGWTPFVHYGAVRQERYFQVYFGNKVMVNKIKMQQSGTAKATSVQIRFSNDGIAWVENPLNVMSPDTGLTDQELSVPAPESARYIRVMISDLDDNTSTASFKFDFVGCATTSDGPSDPCTGVVSTTNPLSDFKRRTFLMAGSTAYVCDMIQSSLSSKQKCYSTPDHLTWTELDDRVGSVIGYESEEPRVYAMSSDGLKYMSSMDGLTWHTSVLDDVTLARAKPTFKVALEVPLTADTNLLSGNPHTSYQDLPYGATIAGLKHFDSGSWSLVFSWSQCCA